MRGTSTRVGDNQKHPNSLGFEVGLPPEEQKPKRTTRYYQLRTGHALIGPYLKKIGKRASDACWWCGVKQAREHLFKSCKKWKSQQAILWAEVRKKTKKRKGQIQISELLLKKSAAQLCWTS